MQQAEKPPIAAAVIVHDGRVLLIQRAIAEGALLWQFPAGEVEDGETGEQAAVRETLEEVGLVVESRELLGERVHPATGRRMIYIACDVIDGEARVADTEEVAAVAWCEPDQLAEYVPHGFYEPVQRHLEAVFTPENAYSAGIDSQ
jgi:8-oxo-dGTP diphosphatase